jgi:hypothetical protein
MTLREIMAAIRRRRQEPPPPAPAEAQADLVEVFKGERKMELKRQGQTIGRYRVALGFSPERHKECEGDGRTPEGSYTVDARNPQGAFHLSLRVSYPDAGDKARAASLGVPPGGDIYTTANPVAGASSSSPIRRRTGRRAASPSPTRRFARSGRWCRPAREW